MTGRLAPAELERLCRALGFKQIFPLHEWEEDGWCHHCQNHRGDGFLRADCTEQEKAWPPIDTEPAWAVKAMEMAGKKGNRAGGLSSGGWDTPIDGYRYGWLVQVQTVERCYTGEGETFPRALCRALLEAIDAGALR